MDLMFALNVLAGIAGFAVGIVLGSLYSAIWLRLAAQWLRFTNVPYLTAFKSALIANFVVFAFNFSNGFNYSLMNMILGQMHSKQPFRPPVDFMFTYSPTYFLCANILGLILTAAIFCRTLPGKDTDSRITFFDSLGLASFYFALSFAFTLLIGLLIFCCLSGLMALMGV